MLLGLPRNCNHFVERVSVALVEKSPPKWINRLAYLGAWIPCIPSIGPLEDEISSFQGPISDNPVIFQNELERKQLLGDNS